MIIILFINISIVLVYVLLLLFITYFDKFLEENTIQNTKKDTQVMKVIHDLKNPIISIQQTILEPGVTIGTIITTCKSDLEDMQEMLENMRAEFKYKQGMSFQEELKEVDIIQFTRS